MPKNPAAQPAFSQQRQVELVVGVLVSKPVALIDDVPRSVDMGVQDEDVFHQPVRSVLGRQAAGTEDCGEEDAEHSVHYIAAASATGAKKWRHNLLAVGNACRLY
jgi:hypothetical protein